MGLLDDAIREHLELKRRHGADPAEVAAQEREVLGGGRRPASASAEADMASSGPEDANAPVPAEDVGQRPAEPVQRAVEGMPQPVGEAPADVRPGGVYADEPDVQWTDAAPAAADLEPEPEEDARERAGAEREDVLEKTPEFLQETPEHDRLWFEQRPPRDFNF